MADFAEPESEHGRRMRAHMSDTRWARIVEEARVRAAIFDSVAAWQAEHGGTWKAAGEQVAAQTPRSTLVRWQHHCRKRTGPTWERLLDGRIPPDTRCSQEVVMASVLLRRLDPEIGAKQARRRLVEPAHLTGARQATT